MEVVGISGAGFLLGSWKGQLFCHGFHESIPTLESIPILPSRVSKDK